MSQTESTLLVPSVIVRRQNRIDTSWMHSLSEVPDWHGGRESLYSVVSTRGLNNNGPLSKGNWKIVARDDIP